MELFNLHEQPRFHHAHHPPVRLPHGFLFLQQLTRGGLPLCRSSQDRLVARPRLDNLHKLATFFGSSPVQNFMVGLMLESGSDRHRCRCSKNGSAFYGTDCGVVNESPQESSECVNNGSPQVSMFTLDNSPLTASKGGMTPNVMNGRGFKKARENGFHHFPERDLNGLPDLSDLGALQNQCNGSRSFNGRTSQDLSSGSQSFVSEKRWVPITQFKNHGQQIYIPHWPLETAIKAIEKGSAFKGKLRVNAHNKFEAYCKIDGIPVDILINGLAAQNRAVEGDTVAIQVDQLSCWTKMKGLVTPPAVSVSAEGPAMAADINEEAITGFVEQGIDSMNISAGESRDTQQAENWISKLSSTEERTEVEELLRKICCSISSAPSRRPTGKVVAILEKSSRRDSVIGHLNARKCLEYIDLCKRHHGKNTVTLADLDYIEFTPADPKFSKMIISIGDLPNDIQKRLLYDDLTLEKEIVAAQIDYWQEDDPFPRALIISTFGQAGEIDTHVASILFENNICCSNFSAESISCLPDVTWSIPQVELENRKDIRNKCIFTIDPPTATDLDDALSFENLSNGNFRIGVHIADVSYFVLPGSALDKEAQERSTSVYMLQRKLPMLPPLLSEDIGSLNPGVDRLAFSVFWEISPQGIVLDRWLGRTVIFSCCKLSYAHAQDIIDCVYPDTATYPSLHGHVEWPEVIRAVKSLHQVSKMLKENRYINGALKLDGPKLTYLFDDFGIPYDGMMSVRCDANFLVEEFMLLANRTVAEVISRAYPDKALLRRHPEPNMRKLKEFEAFCCKHGLDVDISSSGQLHQSLEKIKEKIGDDTVLFDIIVNNATKPMQLAAYFCSGDQKVNVHDWGHYALAVPLYTHFTSPLRRYPDIMVHRTLAAAIEAEYLYLKHHPSAKKAVNQRCFTGVIFDKSAADSTLGKKALSAAASKHMVPHAELLMDVASHCNERKLASKSVQDACHRLYMWVLLKSKQLVVSEARVLGLGPKFMSIYIQKLAIERRIYYDEVVGLIAEWLEATCTLVLSFSRKRSNKKGTPSKWRRLEDIALVVNPVDNISECELLETSPGMESGKSQNLASISSSDIDPPMLPLTVQVFSTIPVVLYAVGGEDGPLDIDAKLFLSSYFG